MDAELILKSDVLDIVFENRNKTYGAYDLRKFYDNRLIRSIGLMLGTVTILCAFTFIPDKKKPEKNWIVSDPVYLPNEKKEEPKEKKEPQKHTQPQTVSTKKWVANFEIVKDSTKTDILDVLKENTVLGTETMDVPGGDGPGPVVGEGGGEGTDPGPATPAPEVVDVTTPMDNPDVEPTFPGGMNALAKFLKKNLTNPRDLEEGEMISVKVRFVVGNDGKLKSFTTVQDGGEEFNKEVIRVLKKMPDWTPGQSKGRDVSVYCTIPVKFVAEN
ncbi:energy transducer TonB [Ferruginibacter sp.]